MINRLTASLIIFALLCSSCEEKGQELGDAKISTDGNAGTLAATDLSALTTFTFIKSYFDISADSNVTNSSIITVSGTLSGTATSTAFNYYDDWDNLGISETYLGTFTAPFTYTPDGDIAILTLSTYTASTALEGSATVSPAPSSLNFNLRFTSTTGGSYTGLIRTTAGDIFYETGTFTLN